MKAWEYALKKKILARHSMRTYLERLLLILYYRTPCGTTLQCMKHIYIFRAIKSRGYNRFQDSFDELIAPVTSSINTCYLAQQSSDLTPFLTLASAFCTTKTLLFIDCKLGGTSKAGFFSKKSAGFRVTVMASTGITG